MKKTHFFDMFLSYVDPIDMSKRYVEIFEIFIHKLLPFFGSDPRYSEQFLWLKINICHSLGSRLGPSVTFRPTALC